MSELEDSNGHVGQDEPHDRWLAMQSAYAEYMRVSEIVKNSRESARDSADPSYRDLTLLDCRQDGFERYLEARMEYMERRYDEGYRCEAAMASRPTPETAGLSTVSRLSGPKWPIIAVLVVGILSVTTFSFVREQKHVRDLDSARDQLRAALSDTQEESQLLAKKLEGESTEHSAVRQVEHTAQPPAPTPQVDGRNPSGEPPRRRIPEPITKATSRSVVGRSYFSLSRSSQSTRVGPIKISLMSIGMQRNSVDVFIVSASGMVKLQRLRLNQRMRIKGSGRQPMELVVDRITPDGLFGHLLELHGSPEHTS
jgi:hypothetical protein